MRRHICLTVLFILFIAACSSSPTADDEPPVQQTSLPPGDEGPPALVVDRSQWSERRLELEERLVDYVAGAPSLNNALHQEPEALDEALEIRVDQQFQFEAEFANFTEANYGDADIEGWASLRLGQMHLEMVCALRAMEAPEEATDEQVRQFRQAIAMQTTPLLVNVHDHFRHALTNGSEPWDEGARELIELLRQFDDEPRQACEEAERYW